MKRKMRILTIILISIAILTLTTSLLSKSSLADIVLVAFDEYTDDEHVDNQSNSYEENSYKSKVHKEKEEVTESDKDSTEYQFSLQEKEKDNKVKNDRLSFEQISEYSQEKHGQAMGIEENHNIPILIFHEIQKDYNGNNGVIISDKTFEEYMLYIKALGYQAINLDDYSQFISGKKQIAKNSVIITFDDGYYSNYEIAYPIMRGLGLKGTVAVIGKNIDLETNSIKKTDGSGSLKYLSWKNAEEMEKSGVFRIEGHTYDLHNMGDGIKTPKGTLQLKDEPREVTEGRIAQDDIMFQQKMQNYLERKAEVFVYPFGEKSDLTDEIYKSRGYKYTLGTKNGISNLKTEMYSLNRINTPVSKSPIEVLSEMLRLEGKKIELPYSNILNQDERISLLKEYIK